MAGKPYDYGGDSFLSLTVRNSSPTVKKANKLWLNKNMFFRKRKKIKDQKPLKRWLTRAVRCFDCGCEMAIFVRIDKPEEEDEKKQSLLDNFTGLCNECEIEEWWKLVKAVK